MTRVWAVLPDIRHWRGDLRRDYSPYFYAWSHSMQSLRYCQYVAAKLRARGISCFVDIV